MVPPKLRQTICLLKYLLISKQIGTLAYAVQKIDIWGVYLRGSKEGGTPKYVKIFVKIYLQIKKTGTLA